MKSNKSLKLPLRYWYLIILSLSGFVTSFGAHIVATNLPPYAEMIGAGAFMIGLLIAVYDFAELFAKPIAGYIADQRGMKITLIAGIVIFISGSLLFFLIDPKFLLLIRFIQGIGAAALSTISITLVAKYFTTERGKAFGIYNAIKGAGYITAPALGGVLINNNEFSMIFIVSAVVGTAALFLSLFLPADHSNILVLENKKDQISIKKLLLIFKEPNFIQIYAIIVINMFLVSILFGFLPLYLYSIGYTPLQSGTTLSIVTASFLLIQPLAGYLADRGQKDVILPIGLFIAAIAIGIVTFTSGAVLIVVIIIAGACVGTVWTNSDALISSMAEQNKLGSSIGIAQSFKELGDMVGPLLIGILTQFFGIRIGFITCSFLALLFLFTSFIKRNCINS